MKLRKALANVLLVPVAAITIVSLTATGGLIANAVSQPQAHQKIILVSDTVSRPEIPARPKSADLCEFDSATWCSRVGTIKDPGAKRAIALGMSKKGHTNCYIPTVKEGKTFQLKQAGTARCAFVSRYSHQLLTLIKACTNAVAARWYVKYSGFDDQGHTVLQIASRYVEQVGHTKIRLCLTLGGPADWSVVVIPAQCESPSNWAADQSFWWN